MRADVMCMTTQIPSNATAHTHTHMHTHTQHTQTHSTHTYTTHTHNTHTHTHTHTTHTHNAHTHTQISETVGECEGLQASLCCWYCLEHTYFFPHQITYASTFAIQVVKTSSTNELGALEGGGGTLCVCVCVCVRALRAPKLSCKRLVNDRCHWRKKKGGNKAFGEAGEQEIEWIEKEIRVHRRT
jgi:hypothetical protein